MNINEHVGKKTNFWDMIKVTAHVTGTAIAQMDQLCYVCVQIK